MSSSSSALSSFDALLDFHQRPESLSPYFPIENNEAETKTVRTILETSDLRGFGILIHRIHGLVILECRKSKKGKPIPHFQIPGGHVDEFEIEEQRKLQPPADNPWNLLYEASKRGCVREIWEETGIDLRESLERVRPLWLDAGVTGLRNEYKNRLFFILELSDADFVTSAPSSLYGTSSEVGGGPGLVGPLNGSGESAGLMLYISHEHTGFQFEKDPSAAIRTVQHHSGGKVSQALRRAFRALESSTKAES